MIININIISLALDVINKYLNIIDVIINFDSSII